MGSLLEEIWRVVMEEFEFENRYESLTEEHLGFFWLKNFWWEDLNERFFNRIALWKCGSFSQKPETWNETFSYGEIWHCTWRFFFFEKLLPYSDCQVSDFKIKTEKCYIKSSPNGAKTWWNFDWDLAGRHQVSRLYLRKKSLNFEIIQNGKQL